MEVQAIQTRNINLNVTLTAAEAQDLMAMMQNGPPDEDPNAAAIRSAIFHSLQKALK